MMRKLCLLFLALTLSAMSYSDPVGENAGYELNRSRDRTSWVIRGGEGVGTVTELRNDEKIGAAYVVSIEYSFDILFHGQQNGVIGLLVPAAMFEDQFYDDLQQRHPAKLGVFDIDYLGTGNARDNDNNSYDQCLLLRIFNIDPNYQPVVRDASKIAVLFHESTMGEVENLELKLKTHESIPVLGAVQIDISGKARGIDFRAGLDFTPES